MALSQHILDSHHSQQGQAGASQGRTWEDVGGSGLCSFHIFLGILYDPGTKHSQISLNLDGAGGGGGWGLFEQEGSRYQAQTGRRWLKEH